MKRLALFFLFTLGTVHAQTPPAPQPFVPGVTKGVPAIYAPPENIDLFCHLAPYLKDGTEVKLRESWKVISVKDGKALVTGGSFAALLPKNYTVYLEGMKVKPGDTVQLNGKVHIEAKGEPQARPATGTRVAEKTPPKIAPRVFTVKPIDEPKK